MKKIFWIPIVAVAIAGVLCIVGYFVHLHHLLARVMTQPSASLTAQPYELRPYKGPTRDIDLGYARFKFPASFDGALTRFNSTAAVALKTEDTYPLTFMPPYSLADNPQLMESQQGMFGGDMKSLYDVQKRVAASRPFSLWDAIRWGPKKAASEATLVMLKGILFVGDSLQLYETDDLGIWIQSERRSIIIVICDRTSGVSHSIMGTPSVLTPARIDQLLGALVPSYQLISADTSDANVENLLVAAGFASQPSPPVPPLPSELTATESDRLNKIADEIRRRRTARPPQR